MTQTEAQAERDAIDAHAGAQVRCPYDPWTQERKYNEWMTAFNKKKLELEMGREL